MPITTAGSNGSESLLDFSHTIKESEQQWTETPATNRYHTPSSLGFSNAQSPHDITKDHLEFNYNHCKAVNTTTSVSSSIFTNYSFSYSPSVLSQIFSSDTSMVKGGLWTLQERKKRRNMWIHYGLTRTWERKMKLGGC